MVKTVVGGDKFHSISCVENKETAYPPKWVMVLSAYSAVDISCLFGSVYKLPVRQWIQAAYSADYFIAKINAK